MFHQCRTPPAASAPASTPAGNPFASVYLSAPAAYPFQSTNLTTSPAAASFNFNQPSTGFGFGAKSHAAKKDNSGGDYIEALKKERDQNLKELNKTFGAKMREREALGATSLGMLEDMNCYLGYYAAIQKPVEDALAAEEAKNTKPVATRVAAAASPPAPAAKLFSFDASASSEKSSSTPRANFSFSVPTNAPVLSPAAPAPSIPPPADDDDGVPSEPRTEVEASSDPDWTIVHEARKVKHYVFLDGKWDPRGAGPLKIEKSNIKSAIRRLVIRDPSTGKVRLNCGIPKSMPVLGKVNKNKYFITITTRRVEDMSAQKFMLRTNKEDYEPMLKTLKELSE